MGDRPRDRVKLMVTQVNVVFDPMSIRRELSQLQCFPRLSEADHSQTEVIKAYVESGEGLDRAGGFAIQVSFGVHLRSSS